jgi:hypothetical protein
MNNGAPITGIDRRPLNKAGMDIRKNPSRYSALARCTGLKNARHHTNNAIAVRTANPASARFRRYWHSALVT